MIAVFIAGKPEPQGSIAYKGRAGNGRAILTSDNPKLKLWRRHIANTLKASRRDPFPDGVHVEAEFVLPRPKSCPKKRTPQAITRPDVDKLLRAVLDAVTYAGVWRDDSQVVSVNACKRLAGIGETPGCHLEIMEAVVKEAQAAA